MNANRKFLAVLDIEFADLAEDIAELAARYVERGRSGEITQYVTRENVALLTHEIHGVQTFAAVVEAIDPDAYDSLDALVADADRRLREKIEGAGFELALYADVHRRLQRVAVFVREE